MYFGFANPNLEPDEYRGVVVDQPSQILSRGFSSSLHIVYVMPLTGNSEQIKEIRARAETNPFK